MRKKNLDKKMKNKVIFVDIDETICETPDKPRSYSNSKPISENIKKINRLYDDGNTIVYWTARGSRTNINWYNLTKKQLEDWGAKYHELRVDKPYYDMFIDDKNLRIEEI
jgi:histidinol phosphatase-like enzyme